MIGIGVWAFIALSLSFHVLFKTFTMQSALKAQRKQIDQLSLAS